MSLPAFLGRFTELPRPEETIRILESEAKHIGVRRLRAGTETLLANGADKVMRAQPTHIDSHEVHTRMIVAEERPCPHPHVIVMQALPKSDRAELVVDLVTEIGVDETILWAAADCVTWWQGAAKVTEAHVEWQSAACEAAKQARRAWIPSVAGLHSSTDIRQLTRETTSAGGTVVVLREGETAPLVKLAIQTVSTDKAPLIAGLEGGINPEELKAFHAAGASSAVFDLTILRSALAGVAALCVLGPLTKHWGGTPTRG